MNSKVFEGLARLAPALGGAGAQVQDLQRLSGGASMETWAFAVEGEGARQDLILRRRPEGLGPSDAAAPLAQEAELIAAARAREVPAPAVLYVCGPEDQLGEAYVMARVEGETLGRKIVADPRFANVRPRLARQCGQILARLHTARPPPGLRQSGALDELDKYEEVYRNSGARRPPLELAFRHLRDHAPEPLGPVLVHGDFRNGNLMIDPEAGVVAVLDWELSHLGDPAEDLGWLCVNSWRFGAAERPVGGFGDYQDLLAGYAEAGGAAVDRSRLRYWQALGSLKWGVMCLMMYASYAAGGEAASVERAMIGRRVSETEIDILNLLEAGL